MRFSKEEDMTMTVSKMRNTVATLVSSWLKEGFASFKVFFSTASMLLVELSVRGEIAIC